MKCVDTYERIINTKDMIKLHDIMLNKWQAMDYNDLTVNEEIYHFEVTLITTKKTQCHIETSKLYEFLRIVLLCIFLWDRCIQVAVAAPQSCILCDKEDLKAKDPSSSYEEFLFEHQVTRQDAINALRQFNDSFYNGPSQDIACKSVTCNKNVMKYCRGSQFINDHCWCELGHTDEGLPFVPHICYVGEKIYTASVGSCFFYEEVKECCCAPELAKQWRHISAASIHRLQKTAQLLCFIISMMLSITGHILRGTI